MKLENLNTNESKNYDKINYNINKINNNDLMNVNIESIKVDDEGEFDEPQIKNINLKNNNIKMENDYKSEDFNYEYNYGQLANVKNIMNEIRNNKQNLKRIIEEHLKEQNKNNTS